MLAMVTVLSRQIQSLIQWLCSIDACHTSVTPFFRKALPQGFHACLPNCTKPGPARLKSSICGSIASMLG